MTHPTPTQVTPHSRSMSDNFQTTNLTVPEPSNSYYRRLSVPTIHHTFQRVPHSQQTSASNVEPRMLQGYTHMAQNPYLQNMSQPVNTGQLAAGPPQLTISTTHGRPIPAPYSASPPHPNQRGPSFSPHPNYGNFTTPDAVHGSGRSAADRAPRTSARPHPYYRGTRQVSPTWDRRQGPGSPDDFAPITSNSQIPFDSSDSATSPGADSDPYYGFPDTPGNTSGGMEEFEAAMKDPRKEKQKLRKQEERRKEKVQYDRVVPLLGLEKPTKADVLERIIELLNGRVPARKNEPTQALQGREERRSERAKQVSASRNDITRLFDEIAHRLGYTDQSAPRRELILMRVADELEQRRPMTGTQFPGPQWGAGQGGHRWTV